MSKISFLIIITFLLLIILTINYWVFPLISSSNSPIHHHYNVGDQVPLFASKVGPLNNPSETYEYFALPFCRPDRLIRKKESLGEVLSGDRLTNSGYDLKFLEMKEREISCSQKLGRVEVGKFREAIERDFYFQMYYDDLPFWGFVGKVESESFTPDLKGPRFYLFTHVQFNVLYSGSHVIEVHAFSDPDHVVDITEDAEADVKFTYSATWNATSAQFPNRTKRYSRASLLSPIQQLHWFSVINSVVVILLSMGLLAMLYWWNIKSDLRKYSSVDQDDKEIGWACIDGDVFRCPTLLSLFCAVLGCGTQLFLMVCWLFLLFSLGLLEPYAHGTLWTATVVIYTVTSAVAGYTSASFHCQFSETGWERSVLLTGILFMGPLLLVLSILNTVAVSYGSTAALPFGTIVMFPVQTCITAIFLALGGIAGRHYSFAKFVPSTKKYVREIPPLTWYKKVQIQIFLGGLLPFSAVLVELHLFYASMWSYKLFTLPSILFLSFSILVCLTAILSVGLTYIQLSVEDPEWWWRSVIRGGSTAIFMFLYCIYFYAKSHMSGLMQLCYFLGYNICICYAGFLILGAIGFRASSLFIDRMYYSVKSE